MKRLREDGELEFVGMGKCLNLLLDGKQPRKEETTSSQFQCKTCNRQFPSFQALGGHRASHKKPKPTGGEELHKDGSDQYGRRSKKMHECSICGLEFGMGQALGGHMRRHRAEMNGGKAGFFCSSAGPVFTVVDKLPVITRSNSLKFRCLDLNLTPLENDLQSLFGNLAPKVHPIL